MTAVVITAALFFCNITPLKNAAKDSLPCPDNTNKFILFWVKSIYMYIPYHIEWLYIQSWQNNQKKIEKIKKIEKNKKCSEQFLGPLPGP